MKKNWLNYFILIFTVVFTACKGEKSEEKTTQKVQIEKQIDTVYITRNLDSLANSEYYIYERLPEWLIESEVLNDLKIGKNYKVENRLNPLYLEEDFNGDGNLDVGLPIYEIKTGKKGFAIIHGKTLDVHILGAGTNFKNALSDDQDYIDIWRINRNKINEPGVEEETGNGKNGELILNNPSVEIAKSELGGGLIYWNGSEYVYFHQTC